MSANILINACVFQNKVVNLQYRNQVNNNTKPQVPEGRMIMETKSLKSSKKMEATIAKLEKKYGKLNRDYFVETIESNRVGRGFYDGCTLTCNILKNLNIVVAHDGTWHQF